MSLTEIKDLVIEARFVASELPGGKQTLLYDQDSLIADNAGLIKRLANMREVTRIDQPHGLRLAVANREAWLDVDPETLYEHQTKLELRLVDTRRLISRLQGRLDNKSYLDSAPAHVVDRA